MKRPTITWFTVLCFLMVLQAPLFGQDSTSFFKRLFKEKPKKIPEKGSFYFSPLPAISVNPAHGFMYGVAASGSGYLGDPESTNISNAFLAAIFTTKKQFIFNLKSTVYTEANSFLMLGDWRYLNSSQGTWGLGTGPQSARLASQDFNLSEDGIVGETGEDILEFELIRFYETVLKRLDTSPMYVGVGFHVDLFRNIKDPLLDLSGKTKVITPYYAYNYHFGFNQDKSTLIGVSLNGVYDTRDNVNTPYKGRYARMQYKYNPKFLGSDKVSSQLWLEYRDYFSFKPDYKTILAFWVYGNFTVSGKLPYMNLPALGWDQYAKSGEPYAQGRFRGEHLIFSAVEFRKHLWATKSNPRFLGGVLFANVTTASGIENGIDLFDYLNPGFGLGVRVNISKDARTNVGLDYGWGSYGTTGIFLKLNETF